MKSFLVFLLAAIVARGVLGQDVGAQAEMVKKRALRIRDQNNINQGITPAASTAPAQAQAVSTAAPHGITPAQQQLIDKLQTDISGIAGGATATAAQKQTVQDDLSSLARGSKPSRDALNKLASDLAAALGSRNVSLRNAPQLAKALNVVMNSGKLSPAQTQSFVTVAQSTLKAGGVGDASAEIVINDLKAVATELQKGGGKP